MSDISPHFIRSALEKRAEFDAEAAKYYSIHPIVNGYTVYNEGEEPYPLASYATKMEALLHLQALIQHQSMFAFLKWLNIDNASA